MNIQSTISHLIKKYGTDNPFELADAMNIAIFYEDLGTINGYYNKPLRMKQIHINAALEEHMKKFTCAHELGHTVLHPGASTPFLRAKTFLSIDKMEIEANTFAVELLIPNVLIQENSYLTSKQLSKLLGYQQALIELRLKSYHETRSRFTMGKCRKERK